MDRLLIEAETKKYPVLLGEDIRHDVGTILSQLNVTPSSILIITDDCVAPLYLDDVKKSLPTNISTYEYMIPSGEASKSFQNYYEIQSFALEKGLDRKSLVIALGGGVVGDLAGFVAATYMRGIPFIQVPTTLLAHDSSVGGKVAINHPLGKNMIGAFYQPEAVIYDTATLLTLPDREWRSGLAEVIKHGFIRSQSFYDWLRDEIKSFSDVQGSRAQDLLRQSISIKATIVKEDEKEANVRAYLNFGHTLAHAIEAKLGYGKITHGEAVVIGMIFALKVSEQYYGIALDIKDILRWLKTYHYQLEIPSTLNIDDLIDAMKKDKKSANGKINMVLLKQIGDVELVSVPEDLLRQVLLNGASGWLNG